MTRHETSGMLALERALLRRRGFLLAAVASVLIGACVRQPERAAPLPTPTATPDLDSWKAEAHGMLHDSLQALRTFDVFAAYRIARGESSLRLAAELAWDPPTSGAWDEATHVTK